MRPPHPRSSISPLRLSPARHFHSTPLLSRRPFKNREPIPTPIPAYPHPPRQWYKQANHGLYGTLSIRVGHTVSERNEHTSRRKWRPNVQTKRLWSEALNRFVRVRLVMRVLKTIDKVGGLDNYLLGDRKGRIRELGVGGWALRWRLWRTEAVRQRMEEMRRQMGLEGQAPWERAEQLLVMLQERTGREAAVDAVAVEGQEESPEQAAKRMEREIDAELDRDEEAAERGEHGGVQLHDDLFEQEPKRRKHS